MNKAFIKENADSQEDEDSSVPALPVGVKNYITPAGYERLKEELMHLLNTERPQVVQVVSWAASNGDRSENGDYLYGKKRLREIDKRIRFLTRRLEQAEIVNPQSLTAAHQVFFGATVKYINKAEELNTITIVGVDEADPLRGLISWVSPVARALNKAQVGDVVQLQTPNGSDELEILEIGYPKIDLKN